MDLRRTLGRIEKDHPERLEKGKSRFETFIFTISSILLGYGTFSNKLTFVILGLIGGVLISVSVHLLYQYEFGLLRIYRKLRG